jgi:hypothetical protein
LKKRSNKILILRPRLSQRQAQGTKNFLVLSFKKELLPYIPVAHRSSFPSGGQRNRVLTQAQRATAGDTAFIEAGISDRLAA